MDRAEFDKFANEYRSLHQTNIAVTGEPPEYFAEYKIKDFARLIGTTPMMTRQGRLLDFGSGVGTSVRFVRRYLPKVRLTCADISMESLKLGVGQFEGEAEFVATDGLRLPFPDSTFDWVFTACVFHHVPHNEHHLLASELKRVLRPTGIIMIYEHNPLNPLTVRAVNACPFDENARLIRPQSLRRTLAGAGFARTRICFRVFFPRALRHLRILEQWLEWLPLGAQYYVCGVKES